MVRQRHQMILSRETGDQISLQSDWKRDTPDRTYSKVLALDAPPSFDDYLHTKNKILIDSTQNIHNQRILQSNWKRDTPGHTYPKVVVSHAPSLNDYLHAKKNKIPSVSYNQRILQSNWTRGTPGHTHPKVVVSHAPTLVDDLHAKSLRYQLILTRDIVN